MGSRPRWCRAAGGRSTANHLLEAGTAGRRLSAVGQARILHEDRSPGAVDAIAFEPAAGRGDDPLPGLLLVFLHVPHDVFLRHSRSLRPGCRSPARTFSPRVIDNTRLKLERLTEHGILVKTERIFFTQPRP
ncbi:hypothetical protein QF037_008874 [Streptomyces canus]|nr:hypothetical protein [Streptomyces canus]